MESNLLKKRLKGIWMDSFGYPQEYVDRFFNSYFNPDLVVWHEKDEQLSAALLGVPFTFSAGSGKCLRGLYICKFSIPSECRRMEIMSSLVENINAKAKALGFDFTFLFPDGEGVRDFCLRRNYHESFFALKDHYVRGHHFSDDHGLLMGSYDPADRDSLLDFLLSCEQWQADIQDFFYLRHSRSDWQSVLDNADLMGEKVYVGKVDGTIAGVMFVREPLEVTTHSDIEVKGIYCMDSKCEFDLLRGLELMKPECNITVERSIGYYLSHTAEKKLWSPFYARNNGADAEYEDVAVVAKPFDISLNAFPKGMIRIFEIKAFLDKCGVVGNESLEGYSDEQLAAIVLRRPAVDSRNDSLHILLGLPDLGFSAMLLPD